MDDRGAVSAALAMLGALMILSGCAGEKVSMPPPAAAATTSRTTPAAGDFQTDVVPFLQARCSPCHFAGGKVYDKLPFDRPETIRALGTKMFTRLKEPRDQTVIRAFIDRAE